MPRRPIPGLLCSLSARERDAVLRRYLGIIGGMIYVTNTPWASGCGGQQNSLRALTPLESQSCRHGGQIVEQLRPFLLHLFEQSEVDHVLELRNLRQRADLLSKCAWAWAASTRSASVERACNRAAGA
jgi:hypothetical protein